MKVLKMLLKILLTAAAALHFTACSKTVQWEEEVLLNTGETIWVSKEVRYTIKGQPGNPADMGYLPDFEEVTSFKYGGRSYTYNGDAVLLVLAISPQKQPILLSRPADGDGTEGISTNVSIHTTCSLYRMPLERSGLGPTRSSYGLTTCQLISCSKEIILPMSKNVTRWQTNQPKGS